MPAIGLCAAGTMPPCIACDHCTRERGAFVCEQAVARVPGRVLEVTGDVRGLTAEELKACACERARGSELCSYSNAWIGRSYAVCAKKLSEAYVAGLSLFLLTLALGVLLARCCVAREHSLALMAASVLSVAGLIYSVRVSRVVEADFAHGEDGMPPLAERAAKAGVDLVPAGLGGAKRRLARACVLWATLGAECSDLARERLSAREA